MSTNTEKLLIRLEADTAELRQKLNEADIVIDKFARKTDRNLSQVGSAFAKLRGTFAALGPALAAAGISIGLEQIASKSLEAFAAMADLNDEATKLGLSVEKLQELGVIAMQNGSDIATMNDGLEQFTKRLGEAQAGSGSLLEILVSYGVAVKDANGQNRSTIDVLNDLSNILASVKDRTEQTRIATEAFGRSGADLIQALSQGSAALERMGQDAQAAGLIMDQGLIEKAAQFDDAWKKVTYWGGVRFKSFAVEAVESLRYVGEELDNFVSNHGRGTAPVTYSKISPEKMQKPMSGFESITSGQNIDGLGSFTGTIQRRMNNIESLPSPFEKVNQKVEAGSKAAAAGLKSATDSQIKSYRTVIDQLKFETEQLDRTSVEQEVYNNLKSAGVDIASAEGRQIAELTRSYRTHADQIREVGEAGKRMGDTITQSLNNAILGTGSLKDSLRSLIMSIANSALTKYITGPAGEMFGSFLSNAFQFENGGIMTSRGAVPLRAYAGGGVASSPQLALYGEGSKPEAYVPLPDGRSIPVTMKGGSGGGSVQVIQHLNISTGVEQTTRAEIMRMMPQIRQAAVAAVGDASRRSQLKI